MDKLIPATTLKVGQQFSADQCNSWWQVTHISTQDDVVITATLISKWECGACQAHETHTRNYCDMHGRQVSPSLPQVGVNGYSPNEVVQVHK